MKKIIYLTMLFSAASLTYSGTIIIINDSAFSPSYPIISVQPFWVLQDSAASKRNPKLTPVS